MTDHQILMLLNRLKIKGLTYEVLSKAVREVVDSVTLLEAARLKGISKPTVEIMRLRGRFPHCYMCECKRSWMIPRDEL